MSRAPALTWRVFRELLVLPDSRGMMLVVVAALFIAGNRSLASNPGFSDGGPRMLFSPGLDLFLFAWPLLLWAGQGQRHGYLRTLPVAAWKVELLRVAATFAVVMVPLALAYGYCLWEVRAHPAPEGLLPGGYPRWFPLAMLSARTLLLLAGMAIAMRGRRPGLVLGAVLVAWAASRLFGPLPRAAGVDAALVGYAMEPARAVETGMAAWLAATAGWLVAVGAVVVLLALWPAGDGELPWIATLRRRPRRTEGVGRPAPRGAFRRLLGLAAAELRLLAPLMAGPVLAAVFVGLWAGRRGVPMLAAGGVDWTGYFDSPWPLWGALVFPVVLWRGDEGAQRAYRRSAPAGRVAADALRVAAGAGWLLLLVHLMLAVVVLDVAVRGEGGVPGPLPATVWPGVPVAALILYLVGTPAARVRTLPMLVAFAASCIVVAVMWVGPRLGGPLDERWGLPGALAPILPIVEPTDVSWIAGLLLWLPLTAAGVVAYLAYAARREEDARWSLSAMLAAAVGILWRHWRPHVI